MGIGNIFDLTLYPKKRVQGVLRRLKDHRHTVPIEATLILLTHVKQVVYRKVGHISSDYPTRSGHPIKERKRHRAFTTSAFPHDAEAVPCLHMKGHVIDRSHYPRFRREFDRKALDGYDLIHASHLLTHYGVEDRQVH